MWARPLGGSDRRGGLEETPALLFFEVPFRERAPKGRAWMILHIGAEFSLSAAISVHGGDERRARPLFFRIAVGLAWGSRLRLGTLVDTICRCFP